MSLTSFIEHLHEVRENVRARGEIRRGLYLASAHVWPHVEPGQDPSAYLLVGGLYAQYPGSPNGARSLGLAYRAVIAAAPAGTAQEARKMRFTGLLNATRENLQPHLRHAVALCEQERQGLDWEQLLRDVLAWDDDERHVQRRLAREVWG